MSNNVEHDQPSHEEQREREPEWRLTRRLVISGHPGTGKTFLINALAKKYNLAENQVIKIGDLFRKFGKEQTGQDPTGYIDRQPDFDKEIDDRQLELLTKEGPEVFIIESKLGGYLTWREREERAAEDKDMPPVFTILLFVGSVVGNQRVFERDRKKNNTLTFEESVNQTLDRKRRDLKLWTELYPIFESGRRDPLSKKARAIYNRAVDTTKLTKETVVKRIHRILVEEGVVGRVNQSPEDIQLPPSGQIFSSQQV